MKSAGSWAEAYPLSSDDESMHSESKDDDDGVGSAEQSNKSLVVHSAMDVTPEGSCFADDGTGSTEPSNKSVFVHSVKDVMPEGADAVSKRAEMYQEYMKQLSIPTHRGSVIPFTTWQGLAKSLKQLYGQPLHYLTNILLKQWDQSRIGTEDEHRPLDTIIHPCKAESAIWLMEEVHRLTSSHHHLAELWATDPMHHAFVDPIIPKT